MSSEPDVAGCALCDKNLYEKRECSKVSTPPCSTLLILHKIKFLCFFGMFPSGQKAVMSAWLTYQEAAGSSCVQ